MPFLDVDGTSIAYDEEGFGPPIVFLHNLGGDRTIWRAQIDDLRYAHQVISIDLLGYGESDTPDTGYTLAKHLAVLDAFVAAKGLRDFTLVGHCFGSALALLFARRHPELVRSLVLSSPLTPATLSPTHTGWAAVLGRHVQLDRLLAKVRVPGPLAGLIVAEQLGAGGPHTRDTVAHLRERWTEPRRLMVTAATSREIPRLAELDSFTPPADFPPVTTIWGLRNKVLSARAGAALNATLRPVRDVEVADAGHLVMVEAPETVTAAIVSAIDYANGGIR
ncbi:alpha/beta fold hydrolase [Nocardia neocaledoniensis]|uniref:alpha/beta fold hydrolase n=1 Tax=Nocardia neocaledoniensis TaxID=236511 RepID=UPI002454161C|nr:alpha/beta fold hydrolase [Nocardia neocaledoniensis]